MFLQAETMYTLKIEYDGAQHATALNEPHHNTVAIDCPFTGKGVEFSPASLFGIIANIRTALPADRGAK